MAEKLKMDTNNNIQNGIEAISKLFPETVTEKETDGKIEKSIDFDLLKQLLSNDIVTDNEERYTLSWPKKRNAVLQANSRTSNTLRPIVQESKNFNNTKNLYIEGDNLEVLKLLQETYLHKIDIIYIDPPYNTGNNLIYHNNFYETEEEYLANSGQLDVNQNQLYYNLESDGRFHTNWLNMIYPRLLLAKNLLKEDGIFICAIDQSEVNTLGVILKEIFSYKAVALISIVHNPSGTQGDNLSFNNEFAYVVYDGMKSDSLALQKRNPEDYDIRGFMNGAKGDTDAYLRTSGNNSFYPIFIKDDKIIGFGNPVDKNKHPSGANVIRDDGIIEVYPIDDDGIERKWLFERNTVESIVKDLEVKYNKQRKIYEIIRIKKEFNYKSCWTDKKYNAKENGTILLKKILGENCFSFPKSLYTVMDCLSMANHNKNDAIILDFFSGSSTTAHAIMEMNAKDQGKRKFIMVQLPENLDENLNKATSDKEKKTIKTAIKFCDSQKFEHTIAEIAKERIRKSGDMIRQSNPKFIFDLDIGFRVLKLDSSNMNDVYYNPKSFSQSLLEETVDNIKSDRTPLDLLFQVMIELGIELSSKIEEKEISGKKYYLVNDNNLIACFDDDLSNDVLIEIAKLQPLYAVFKDKSFSNDSVGINNEQIFKTYSQGTIIKVL